MAGTSASKWPASRRFGLALLGERLGQSMASDYVPDSAC